MAFVSVWIDNEKIAEELGCFHSRIRLTHGYEGGKYKILSLDGKVHWVDRKDVTLMSDLKAAIRVESKTSIKCGFFCENNYKGNCSSNEITIDEDRTCSNYKYDVTKAVCGYCSNHDCDNEKCLEDEVHCESSDCCHNRLFESV